MTLEDDLAVQIQKECRRTGKSFKKVVNEFLRKGMGAMNLPMAKTKFKIQARPLGFRKNLDYNNIGQLLEQIEPIDK